MEMESRLSEIRKLTTYIRGTYPEMIDGAVRCQSCPAFDYVDQRHIAHADDCGHISARLERKRLSSEVLEDILPDLSDASIASFKERFDAASDDDAMTMFEVVMYTAPGAVDRAKAVHHVFWRRIFQITTGVAVQEAS